MNIPSLREEKKVDDQVEDDTCRIERLERLVEILCNDIFHIKEQQLRSQKQVLDLQADLAAAELAREEAERQMEQLQLRDHNILVSLLEKQQEKEEQTVIKIPHNKTFSIRRNTPRKQNIDLIDVTSYEENITEYEDVDEHVYHLDDVHADESSCDQQIMQLWEDLSLSVQHLSSDLVEQRDAFEFVWTKFQLTNNQRMTALEDANANQLDALKGMAVEWDTKLTELSEQIEAVNHEFSSEKTSSTNINDEMKTKLKHLDEQLLQMQSSLQRHMDYNRCKNGEGLVMKREQELQFQKLNDMIQNLNTTIQEQADQILVLQSVPSHDILHPTVTNDTFVDESTPVEEEECVNDCNKDVDNTKNDVIRPERDCCETLPTMVKATTTITTSIEDLSPDQQHHDNIKELSPAPLQRCQSY